MRVNDWQIRLIQLLSVPGIVVAYYLLLFHKGSVVSACHVSSIFDCGQVSGPDAPYAAIGPAPVALIGLIGYAVIFLTAWLQDWAPFVDENMAEIMLGLTGFACLFTLFLNGLELFKIGAFCQYCVISAVIVAVMLGLSVCYMRSVSASGK